MDKKLIRALSLVTQLAVSMLVPILLCLFIGIVLDRWLNTSPLFIIIFILLGVGGGFRSVYMLTRSFFTEKDTYLDINQYKRKGDVFEKGDNSKPNP